MFNYMKRIIFAFLCILSLHNLANAQDDKFKALFVYNFTKYIEWPKHKQTGDFVIGVLGHSPIINELKSFTERKSVGSQKIVVEEILSSEDYTKYHIVYVPTKLSAQVTDIVKQIKGKGVLVVTDKPGMAASLSAINFVKIDNQQKYEVNTAHLTEEGVKHSQTLVLLGIAVNN